MAVKDQLNEIMDILDDQSVDADTVALLRDCYSELVGISVLLSKILDKLPNGKGEW